jgi:hypothetical protein
MLYVVSREVEGSRIERVVFSDLETAAAWYEEAAYVVRNAPGEDPGDDPTIVTAAFLHVAQTLDPETAKVMAEDGRAELLQTE